MPEFRVRRKVANVVGARVFGLTGGIGSGKSTVASLFRARGLEVVSADELARQAVVPASSGLAEIETALGPGLVRSDGTLDRSALAQLVFETPSARATLNAILHPRIQRLAEQAFARASQAGSRLICYDAPLLFETGSADRYRPILVVDAPRELRRQRASARDGITSGDFERRDQSQMPLEEKVQRADFVINNAGEVEALEQQVAALIPKIFAFLPQ